MKVKPPVKKQKNEEVVGTIIGVDLPAFKRPKYADDIKWPDDITQLEAANISELIGKYTAMLCYAQSLKSQWEQKVIRTEAAMANNALRQWMENPRINNLEKFRRDAVIASDDGMIILKTRLSVVKTLVSQAQMHVENYERQISALSRELSRKLSTRENRFQD